MNKAMLKSVMILHGDTIADLAEYLNISVQSVINKMGDKRSEFKQSEITKIKERYDLTAEQLESIFFN